MYLYLNYSLIAPFARRLGGLAGGGAGRLLVALRAREGAGFVDLSGSGRGRHVGQQGVA